MDALEELLDEFDRGYMPVVNRIDVPAVPVDRPVMVPPAAELVYQLLFPYQIPHVRHLVGVLERRSSAIDGSDTGTGKMYSGCAIAAILGRRPLICCPKSVVAAWFEVAARFDLEVLGVTNYEALRTGKYYPSLDSFMREQREECPWYDGNIWDLPDDALVIYDEAHKCRRNTATADMMTSTVEALGAAQLNSPRILLASATIADSTVTFRNAAYILGLAQRGRHAFAAWVRRITRDGTGQIEAFYRAMYPAVGARMRIVDIKAADLAAGVQGMFADNVVQSLVRVMSPDEERGIMDAYGEIADAIDALKTKQRGELHPLTVILRARQRIEMLKVPSICMQAMEWRLQGRNVIVFVNFDASVDHAFGLLDKFTQSEWPGSFITVIRGGQKPADRQWNINSFQSGRSRIIICNIRAGGVGISLHGADRASIISPPWSAIDFKQAEGRAYRAGGGDVLQYVIYCSGNASPAGPDGATNDTMFIEGAERIGVEEKMARSLNRKLATIHILNGDDAPRNI